MRLHAGSGIGIVRISGEEAVSITDQIFHMPGGKKLSDMETHTIHYGHICDGEEVIDEVMVLLMRGPRSYTREDTVEIDCHGRCLCDEAHFGDSYQIWSETRQSRENSRSVHF